MEKQEEELKSRRNVAAKQGQRTRQKDCEERERDGEGKRKREGRWKEGGRESVPQGRANAAFTFHLSRGHNLLQQGSACPQFDKSNGGSDKCRPSAAVDSAVGVAARQSRRQWLLVSTPQPVQLALCLIQPVARGRQFPACLCMLCVIMCASLGLYVVASRVASVAHTLPVARCEIEITYLIAEDLYLTVAAMEDRRIARILERIDLYMQRQALFVGKREQENICSMEYMYVCVCM